MRQTDGSLIDGLLSLGMSGRTDLKVRSAMFASWAASLLVAIAAGWMAYAVVPTNVDVAWLMVAGDRLLDGARLHVDVVEINPPFSVWLYMPFVLAERATGLPAEFWLSVGLPTMALLSVSICMRILGRCEPANRDSAWMAPAVLAVLLCIFIADFGQREQFATVALMPWLALLAARDGSENFEAGTRFERVVAGLGAALFVIVKPPLSLPALALPALALCVRRRSLHPVFTSETMLGAATTLAYLIWLATFHKSFFVDLVPLLSDLYLPARKPVLDMLLSLPVIIFAMLAAATLLVSRPEGLGRFPGVILLAAVGYVPAFVLMGKGWTYQALPFLLLGMVAFLLQLGQRKTATTPLALGGLVTGTAIIALLVWTNEPSAQAVRRTELENVAARVIRVVEHPTVATIATRLQAAHPLTRMVNGDYRSRYPGLWMVENAAKLISTGGADVQQAARLRILQADFISRAVEDIERARPDIIFDAGTKDWPGQAVVRSNPAIQGLLGEYRTLYRGSEVTVLVRSDLVSGLTQVGSP
ncbi:hypothetical protein [Mesorhizobium marinum]|uniref:hypothetical protein n=1 Tax=Mesorhizobium marinum TaxID=3228790 RepID=UPI003467946A